MLAGGLDEPVTELADDDGFARANIAFERLRRFEIAICRFIDRVMRDAFGEDWMKHQLPAGMLDVWREKREKAIKAGEAEQALIDYADFSDYRAIIERKDNWAKVFSPVFGRAEDVRESFQRSLPDPDRDHARPDRHARRRAPAPGRDASGAQSDHSSSG